jgi:phosphoglycerate dehydrogenase-like enzyme
VPGYAVCAGVRAAGGGAWAVPVVDGAVPASSLSGFDALILLGVQFTADSVPADGRLSLVARFGVGYDGVDIEACSSAGIICSITPDGVRRPVAVRGLWMNLRVHVLAHGQGGGVQRRWILQEAGWRVWWLHLRAAAPRAPPAYS